MLGGSQGELIRPGEGNWLHPGPTINITDSPDCRKQIAKITGTEITRIPDNRNPQLVLAAVCPRGAGGYPSLLSALLNYLMKFGAISY